MTIAPDMLMQFGGAPVGSTHNFEGWWGKEVFFVDYDNGTTGARGTNMDTPTKNLQAAIDAASTDATIYLRPRAFSSEDPQQITPATADAENFHIDAAKTNMSIIGTGKGLGHAAAHKAWIGGYGSLTTAILSIYAPGCVIENLRAQPGSSTSGIFYSINNATYDGGNATIINNDFHDGTSSCPALVLDATWQMEIVGNRFLNCDIGIKWDAVYCEPTIIQVRHNTFLITAAEAKCDVYSTGGVKRFLAYGNYHAAAQPAGGSPNKYYCFSAASTGAILGCYFGVNDTADTNFLTLNGVVQGGNFCADGQVLTS